MKTGTWNDNRKWARRHLPRGVFDFIDGASEDEFTARENRRGFEDLSFKPRVLAGVGTRDQSVTVLGETLDVPILTAPTGLTRMAGRTGEKAAAIATEAVGTTSILSASTSMPMSAIAESVSRPQWLQVYLYQNEEMTLTRIRAAKEYGFRVLVVTADAPISGNRERDARNGMSIPFRLTPKLMKSAITKPRWLIDYLTGPPMVDETGRGKTSLIKKIMPGRDQSIANVMKGMFHSDQNWDDLRHIRKLWDGPLVLKGIMCAEDAQLAVDAGCDGVIVSNHGGRQLDGLPSTIDVLPEIVAAVEGKIDVLLDSGVRRGADVVKALALGANACLIGRPWVFGLANGGPTGVEQVLRTLSDEIDRVMALVGVSTIDQLSPNVLRRRAGSGWL